MIGLILMMKTVIIMNLMEINMQSDKLKFGIGDELGIQRAKYFFGNHWGVSVIQVEAGSRADITNVVYSSSEPETFEVAVIVGKDEEEWTLSEEPIFSYQSKAQLESIMERVSQLEPPF